MTQNEVINKLSMEMFVLVKGKNLYTNLDQPLTKEDFDDLNTYRWFIRQALTIGIDHFTKDMEEIIQMDLRGVEMERYKSTQEASDKTGIYRSCITDVIIGRAHSAGGFTFIKTKDKELVPVNKTA